MISLLHSQLNNILKRIKDYMSSNKSNNKNLIKGIIIYSIGNFGTKILSFLIVPLYTYYISTESMGIYDLLITTVNLLAPLVTLQISDAAYSWMIQKRKSNSKCIAATIHLLIFNTILVTILITLVYFIHPFKYYVEFILLLATSNILTVIQKLLRGIQNQKLFAFSGIFYTAIFLTLNIIQICIFNKGIQSLLLSSIIANIITIIIIFIIEKRVRINLFGKIDTYLIKSMLRFSIPLIPNQLSWWVINSSDRYIIGFFLGNSANGIFSIAYKFPTILQMIMTLFNTAWQDVSISDTNKNNGKYYSQVFKNLYRLSFSLLFLLVPLTKLAIILVMESSYKMAAYYVSFLYLGTVFQSFSSFYGVGYLRGKNTKNASTTSIYGAIVNIVVNLVLIKFIGLQAAAISTFLGFLIMWIIREKQNRRELGIRIEIYDFLKYSLPALLLCIISCFTNVVLDIVLTIIGIIYFVMINKNIIEKIIKKIFDMIKK